MKKTKIFLTLILLISITFLIPYGNQNYNIITGLITCNDHESCIHESAHKIDAKNNWISKSDNWIKAVNDYRMVQYALLPNEKDGDIAFYIEFFPGVGAPREPHKNIFSLAFWQGGWGGYTELYASIVEYANGDINQIPESLRGFYDMEEINEIMKGLNYAD
jgi:hypothetical protein